MWMRTTFTSCFYFGLIWRYWRKSEPDFMVLQFLSLQIILVPLSGILIFGRMFGLLRNRRAWFYRFLGTVQVSLFYIDFYVIVTNKSMSLVSGLIFLGLNLSLAIMICLDSNKGLSKEKE